MCVSTFAQDDVQAKAILDNVSSKNNSYKTIRSDFKYTRSSMQDNQLHVENGKIIMKGD